MYVCGCEIVWLGFKQVYSTMLFADALRVERNTKSGNRTVDILLLALYAFMDSTCSGSYLSYDIWLKTSLADVLWVV